MTYTYQCVNLKHVYIDKEITRSMFESEKIPNCPICERKMVRKFDAAPTHFTGGGWGKDAR